MNLKELQKNWNKFGKQDPLWAICTVPHKKGKKRWELEEFFETGTTEIASVLDCVAALGITIQMKKALDFGCGVGRLTQALAKHFDEVIGVDIAPSMLKRAKKYNRFGDRCKYYLNEANDLSIFADSSFDFIYTNMVLQHMQPSYAKAYIREFLRVLTPRSVAIFQLAGGKLPEPVKPEPIPPVLQPQQPRGVRRLKDFIKLFTPAPLLRWYLNARYGEPIMEMYVITREEIEPIIKENQAHILDIRQDEDAGPGWISFRYIVARN